MIFYLVLVLLLSLSTSYANDQSTEDTRDVLRNAALPEALGVPRQRFTGEKPNPFGPVGISNTRPHTNGQRTGPQRTGPSKEIPRGQRDKPEVTIQGGKNQHGRVQQVQGKTTRTSWPNHQATRGQRTGHAQQVQGKTTPSSWNHQTTRGQRTGPHVSKEIPRDQRDKQIPLTGPQGRGLIGERHSGRGQTVRGQVGQRHFGRPVGRGQTGSFGRPGQSQRFGLGHSTPMRRPGWQQRSYYERIRSNPYLRQKFGRTFGLGHRFGARNATNTRHWGITPGQSSRYGLGFSGRMIPAFGSRYFGKLGNWRSTRSNDNSHSRNGRFGGQPQWRSHAWGRHGFGNDHGRSFFRNENERREHSRFGERRDHGRFGQRRDHGRFGERRDHGRFGNWRSRNHGMERREHSRFGREGHESGRFGGQHRWGFSRPGFSTRYGMGFSGRMRPSWRHENERREHSRFGGNGYEGSWRSRNHGMARREHNNERFGFHGRNPWARHENERREHSRFGERRNHGRFNERREHSRFGVRPDHGRFGLFNRMRNHYGPRPGFSSRYGMGFSGRMHPWTGRYSQGRHGYQASKICSSCGLRVPTFEGRQGFSRRFGSDRSGRTGQPTSTQYGRFRNTHSGSYNGHVGRLGLEKTRAGSSLEKFVHPTARSMRSRQIERTTHGRFETLLNKHDKIYRHVERIPCGVKALTVSHDPQVAEMIKKHAHDMKIRMHTKRPVRSCDPIFKAFFESSKNINVNVTTLKNGVLVEETSRTCLQQKTANNKKLNPVTTIAKHSQPQDCTEQIIVAHATTISKIVANGNKETRNCKRHEAPTCFKSRS